MLENDEVVLRRLARECKDAKEKTRLLALHAISIGNKTPHIAEVFCVDEETVRRWIERWQQERSLADKPKDGKPPTFTEQDRAELKRLVEENDPKKHGFNASFWDTKELHAYFLAKRKAVCRETIRSALKEMNARYIKAQLEYAQADEEKRKAFALELLKNVVSKPNNVVILFQDEMSAYCSPRKGYGWTFEKRLVIRAPQTRIRLNNFGVVNPLEGEVIQMPTKEAKAPAFVKFLEKIKAHYPHNRVWIYADNLPVHKSALVKEFLAKNSNIEIRFIPSYSPDLNPAEPWWKHMRQKLLNNRYFHTQHQLATNINWFGRKTPAEQIIRICSLTPIQKLIT